MHQISCQTESDTSVHWSRLFYDATSVLPLMHLDEEGGVVALSVLHMSCCRTGLCTQILCCFLSPAMTYFRWSQRTPVIQKSRRPCQRIEHRILYMSLLLHTSDMYTCIRYLYANISHSPKILCTYFQCRHKHCFALPASRD